MDIRGQCELPAHLHAVWHFLATPEHVSQCVPGLAHWKAIIPSSQFQLWLRLPLAPVAQPLLPVILTWVAQQPPTFLQLSLTMPFAGQEIPGTAYLTLQSLSPTQTRVDFHVAVTTENRFVQQIIRQHAPPWVDAFFVAMQGQLQAKA